MNIKMASTNIETKNSTEEVLLKQIHKGNNSAFWSLWNRHQEYLYNLCFKWMNNNSVDAQEALSSAMIRAWEKLPEHAFKLTNTRGWLTRLTYNVCIDIHRKKEYSLSVVENLESITQESSIDSPEMTIMYNELRIVLYHLIKNLPDNLKNPVILRFIQEKTYREISEMINLSEENVRKRIQQGRLLLKQSILQYLAGSKNFSPLAQLENEDNNFYLGSLQLEQSVNSKNNSSKNKEQDLEILIYRLSATHLETLPHRHSSLGCSLQWY
ncbi:MAG: sigma-70 family RNA polymerase sigma factor [Symploca sp. SIO1C4]|uniref:Sigma-70 family RNA polymerase sigma factor n=1 Tax=Symploca sp. SIO1C4 TaxID=2607765 RepID=A0A6B3N9X1_9CYAN|nr:sigma-70 family RNA polymerase sigma factor [Symploca sp. SIO1C4]